MKNIIKKVSLLFILCILLHSCKEKNILDPNSNSGNTPGTGNGGVNAVDSVRYIFNGTRNVIRRAEPGSMFFRIVEKVNPEIVYNGPTIVNGNLYYSTNTGELNKIGLLDKASWMFKASGQAFSDPIYSNGMLVLSAVNAVFAINESTGEEVWKYKASNSIRDITIFEDMLIFGEQSSAIVALSLKTGQEKWRYKLKDGLGNLFISDGVLYTYDNSAINYLDPKTGSQIGKAESTNLVNSLPNTPSKPFEIYFVGVKNKTLYFRITELRYSPPYNTVISNNTYAYQISTGKVIWSTAIPLYEIKDIFYNTKGSTISSIDTKTGSIIWEHVFENDVSKYAKSGKIFYSIIKKGKFGTLVAYDTEQSTIKWEYLLESTNSYSTELDLGIMVAQGMVFICQGGAVVMVDKTTGKFVKTSFIDAGLFERPSILYLKSGKVIKAGESD